MFRSITSLIVFTLAVTGLAFSAKTAARAPQQTLQPAELVLTNGKVVTLEDGVPDAQAVASTGGRIVAVGTNAEIQKYVGP